jgi:hypothetical protein
MRLKKLYGLGLAVALMAPVGVLTANPAAAAGGTKCTGQTGSATIKPGLGTTKKDQTITATTTITKCTGGGVKSGKGTSTVKVKKGDCAGLAKTGTKMTLTETIKWNTGATSKLSGTSTTGPKVGQATIKMKVTSGPFKNLTATTTVSFAPAPGGGSCTDASPLKKLTVKGVKPLVIK